MIPVEPMNILVCVKQVPDLDQAFCIDDSGRRIIPLDTNAYRIGRFDLSAVEEAVRIQKDRPGVSVDILTVGPDRSTKAIKRALGMGGDHGILIRTGEQDLSPFTVAGYIADYAGTKPYGLIFAGMMSEDAMQGIVGPLVAEFLQWPCAAAVVHQHFLPDEKSVYVERETDAGAIEMLEISLPAVLTFQSGINQPRYPSLSKMLNAGMGRLEIIEAAAMKKTASRQYTHRISFPRKSRAGLFLEGSEREKATLLMEVLIKKGFIG